MRYIILDDNNKIISIRLGKEIVAGEIQSDIGEIGQIMQEDGTFINAPIEQPVDDKPSLEDKINYIYYKQIGVI